MKIKYDDHPIQQAARGIVAHYEGEAGKWQADDFTKRVNEVAQLIAAALAVGMETEERQTSDG